ncbi:AAA family ATPase [Nostoc sp.]|uniref:AAA family ATPase n=1 Tax=Nostoc sp. TaxID=1180 RepID=UPI002FF69639
MYLTEYLLENAGPIANLDISLPFNEDGKPQPLVLVGVNGSGKSIFISYIVDALTEFAKTAYQDILVGQQPMYSPYFKITGGINQKVYSEYSIGLLEFSKNDKKYCYVDKSGNLDPNTYNQNRRERFQSVASWTIDQNQKLIAPEDKKAFEDFFRTNAICYFPPSRKELPHWLNRHSLSDELKFLIEPKFTERLGKPIFIDSSVQENKIWLLDVFLDCMMEIENVEGNLSVKGNINEKVLLNKSRQNVEIILKQVLQDNSAKFAVNYRSTNQFRLCITKNNLIAIPSLDALSSGQSILFNMFATIIRYADKGDIHKSINLTEIEGIVIIDEIDVHLHTELQYKVLPKLLKLFPRVQFIITSHSPLFLLGMEEEYGEQGLKILEMPKGDFISTERFSEFKHSFTYYKQTKAYEDELIKTIKPYTRPILITEGKTDAQIIRVA